jgi:N-methylhydantoinase B
MLTLVPEPDVDEVKVEVIRHALTSAADHMKVALIRSAFSPVIYDVVDFAAGLYDRQLRLLAQAQALPLFMGTLSFCIDATLERVGGTSSLEPGDVIFSSYGYDIGSHPQDAVVILPVFHDEQLLGYSTIKAHHQDIGAKQPYCTDTTDNFQEGLIFPGVKLYRAGELQRDLYRVLLANSRMPRELVGDLNAQIGAATVGADAFRAIVARHGAEVFEQAVEIMLRQSEAAMRSYLEQVPDGVYTASGAMDNDGITDDPIPLTVRVEVAGGDITIDLTDAPDARPGPINTPYASTVSGVRVAIMSFAAPFESATEGHFAPIHVRTRPGSMFDAQPPSPIFMYGWPMLNVIDLIHKAVADAAKGTVPAGSGGDVCALILWGRGADRSFWVDGGDHFVGQGAMETRDGGCPLMHISCSGIRSLPAEALESRRRLIVEQMEYAVDSAGAGRHRGGLGVDITYRIEEPMNATISWERTKTAPWGLAGGLSARANECRVTTADGISTSYSKITDLHIPPGSRIEIRTGGGGGYGEPSLRDLAAIERDLADGLITEEAAATMYPQLAAHREAARLQHE